MTIIISTNSLIIDETLGLQDDDVPSSSLQGASASVYAHLVTDNDFPRSTAGAMAAPEIAYQANFITFTPSGGSSIADMVLAQDASGTPFSLTMGVDSGISTVEGEKIWLFADATNTNILLGRTGVDATASATGDVAFSLWLDEAGDHQSAGLYMVQYAALYHADATNPDDRISLLSNAVFVSVDTIDQQVYSDFSDVHPGNTDFAIIAADGASGSGDAQLLVVGFEDGNPASVNVSTQGIGAGEQSIGVGAAVQVDLISGGTQGTGSANEIAYANHIETQQASFQITQINPDQGGNNRVDVTIAADNVTGDEQGNEFYDGSPVTSIAVTRVQVLAADGVTVLEDSADPLIDDPDITVSFVAGIATVNNLLVEQSVRFFTNMPMDRFTVTNVDGAKNTSFDIGGFKITTEQEGASSEAVGSLIQSDDDGPTIVAGQNAPTLVVDEKGIPGLDACGDETAFNTVKASFASIFEIDAGSDDALIPPGLLYELGTVGGNSGLKDEATNLPVILSMLDGKVVGRIDDGGIWKTVLTISVDVSGEVTFTQDRPVVQPDPMVVDDQVGFSSIEDLVTLKASLADEDHDPVSLTRDITASFLIEDHGCDDCANPIPPRWNSAAVIGTDNGELLKGTSVDGRGGNDTIQGGNKADLFYGGDGDDNLQPGNGDDSVDGGAGNDTISGGFGNDLLIGGSGNDSISGGPGNDTAWGGDGDDSISGSSAGDDCLHGNAGNDTINGGIDNDEVWGDEGNDFLVGNVGNDTLFGGSGNDFIRGDEGNDQLYGGEGADIFYFGKNSGTDVIHDFETGMDDINVKGLGLTSWAKVQAVLAYDASGAHIDVGTNHIRVNDVTSLSASDFIFV